MKDKFQKRVKEVFKIKNHLYKLAPKISDVDIKIEKNNAGLYKTRIFVSIPKTKPIVSTKQDESISLSLERAHKAIIKQIEKSKFQGPLKHKGQQGRKTIRRIDVTDYAA